MLWKRTRNLKNPPKILFVIMTRRILSTRELLLAGVTGTSFNITAGTAVKSGIAQRSVKGKLMPNYPRGRDLILHHQCPIKAEGVFSCENCYFGHPNECHFPKTCSAAKCKSLKNVDLQEEVVQLVED